MQNLLIIFTKNLELGKVKSRLARDIGPKMALSVYEKLIKHTRNIVVDLKMDKRVCYSNYIVHDDLWETGKFQKGQQKGKDLGERMHNAIATAFNEGYSKICVIGSDMIELEQEVVIEAFHLLGQHDVVLGPAKDGGYYLIGANAPQPILFENKTWGTETVLAETIADIKGLKLRFARLPVLNDIDEIEDIRERDRAYLLS